MSRLDINEDLSAFVGAWQHPVQRAAFLLCGDRQRAEDVVQTVLLRMCPRALRTSRSPTLVATRTTAASSSGNGRRAEGWGGSFPPPFEAHAGVSRSKTWRW